MASSIVISTAKQLGGLLVDEVKYLHEVSDKIEDLQDDLRWMHVFLEDADNRQNSEKVVAMWVSTIRDLAYEAEEIIERYVHRVSRPRQKRGWNTIRWLFCVLPDAPALHEVGSKIDNLRSRIEKLMSRLQIYGIKPKKEERLAYNNVMKEQRETYSHIEEDPIGLEKNAGISVNELVKNEQVKVVGIWGMGGLGKTTLARQVFQDTTTIERFKKRIWVCISKNFEKNVVFREILSRLGSEVFTDGELPEKICEALKQQDCLVVLDDIWTNAAWDALKPAFDSIKSSRSKILITTRSNGLMKHIDLFGYSHNPNLLDEEDSWELLQQIVFPKIGNTAESSTYQEGGSDQTKQEDGDLKAKEALGRKMLKHCKGLPLAILSLGGILCGKKTITEWETVQKNIASFLMGDIKQGGDDKGLFAILELSFNDLPFYLKPCFVYLGIFPEAYRIAAYGVYRLWEAEGLVTVSADDGDEIEEIRLDDIAELYLNELVERCLVQVDISFGNGRIKYCRLHDVVRAMCLKKCKEVDFLRIIKHERSKKPSSKIARSSLVNGKLCQCALYLGEANSDDDLPFDTNPNIDPCIRSLLVFQHGEENWGKRLFSPDLSGFLSRLRVLHLGYTSIPLHCKTPLNFIHLRYLCFRGAKSINSFPKSIWDCKYLETLDLQWDAENVLVSNMFWKLERLRHLYLPFYLILDGSKWLKLKDNQLQQMETLTRFNVEICKIEDLEKMTSMRVFAFSEKRPLSKEEVQHFLNSPMTTTKRLKIPAQLSVMADVINEGASLLTAIQDHVGIDYLQINGRIDPVENLIKICHNLQLTALVLVESEIGQEEISIIEKLPHLEHFAMACFRGENLSFSSGGFLHLKSLTLWGLPNLEGWEVGEGALPKLENLYLRDCNKLKMIPQSLPKSVYVWCENPYISGVEKYNICTQSAQAAQFKNPSPSLIAYHVLQVK